MRKHGDPNYPAPPKQRKDPLSFTNMMILFVSGNKTQTTAEIRNQAWQKTQTTVNPPTHPRRTKPSNTRSMPNPNHKTMLLCPENRPPISDVTSPSCNQKNRITTQFTSPAIQNSNNCQHQTGKVKKVGERK